MSDKPMQVSYDDLISSTTEMAKNKQLTQALDKLFAAEKQSRTAGDASGNGQILVQIVTLCFESGQLDMLNEHVTVLSKKHGLLKQAVTIMIQQALTYVDKIADKAKKLQLINTLRTVTEGKIFVEVERARVTRILAAIQEKDGKIAEAATTLQEIQVETFGSMERREKTDFILEQMRLTLAKKDFNRTLILSKKISTKFFEEPENQDLKLRYYELMVQLSLHDDQYLNVCKYYRHIYDTPSIKGDASKLSMALQNIVMFIVLAAYDNEQSDLIHRINLDSDLSLVPLHKQLLKAFITNELMRFPKIDEIYGAALKATPAFDLKTDGGKKRWKDLHARVIEHNIRVISQYYTRITLPRLQTLLDLSASETEEFLSRLVVQKTIFARIDRPAGIVCFEKKKDVEETLNEWGSCVNSLLKLIEESNHLIAKEEMVYGITKVV